MVSASSDCTQRRAGLCGAAFVVVGDGPEREMLERAAGGFEQRGVCRLAEATMAQVYSASDLLASTSDERRNAGR